MTFDLADPSLGPLGPIGLFKVDVHHTAPDSTGLFGRSFKDVSSDSVEEILRKKNLIQAGAPR